MANVPFPPLFCSTPPPIDDEPNMSPINDDEDFGDFADAYQENLGNYMENNTDDDFNAFHNAQFVAYVSNEPNKAPITKAEYDLTERNIPQTKLNSDYMNAPDIDSNENDNKSNSEENFNVQLTNNDTASFSSLSEHQSSSATSISPVSKSPSPRIEAELDGDDKDFGEFGQFDKSIEVAKSDSGRSTENDSVSQDANLKSRNAPDLTNIVVVEDLVDDSSDDERHSIRNRNNIYCDEASRDFFAIHAIEDNKVFENNMQNIPCESDGNAVHLEVQPVVPATDASTERLILAVETAASVIPDDSIQKDLTQLSLITQKKEFNVEEKGIQKYETVSITSDFERNDIKSSHNEGAISQDMDDDFANFQDFSSAPCTWQKTWPASAENSLNQTIEKPLNELPKSSETYSSIPADQVAKETTDNSADDDDDFGDFTEAPVVATSHIPQSTQPTMPAAKYNLNEQLKSILKIMFPNVADSSETASIESNTPKPQTNNLTNSVESAKALEYQWSGSMVRHAFIKSLGIDSRNIFLTEKWNPAMPRFAANLSFDPLQPLKPTSVPLQPETVSGAANNSKSDVPVAEFDWKSSGLVNPLDASHVHTLLLDVDQLVVVANLDNINLDSSSSCSQSSSSIPTTTTTCTLTTAMATLSTSNNMNETMMTSTSETSTTTTMFKNYNGTIINAFHGDNLQLNSIDYKTLCTTTESNAFGTAFQCQTNNIIDLPDTGNVNVLLSTVVDNSQNNCIIPLSSHYYNNNINNNNNNKYNANTSFDAFNEIDTICFDSSVTTIAPVSASNLLLPTTSVAFTNNLQFNKLHNSLAAQTSSNLTSILPSITTITTTTTTTTPTTGTTKPTTDITNINAHHFKNFQMQLSTVSTSKCLNTNLYWESRPQAEMVRQSIDASKAESSISDVVENESNSNADGSHTTTETSTVAASTTGGTLSSTLAGRGNIDSSDNNFDHNIDIGLYDVLSSKRATQLPKENVSIESNSLDLEENLKHSEDSKVLDTVGCATIESSIPLHMVYSVDDDAEVHIDNGVISRSTYAGPLKETHIFTPSKNMPDLYEKNMPTAARTVSPATTIAPKVFPIDFDYEKAAAGIIIDEKVVHKEYRDVEYNPGFGLEGSHTSHIESPIPKQLTTLPNTWNTSQQQEEEIDDDFSDFQSVPPPEPLRTATPRNDKLSTPTPVNGMILSPAILLPQAISIENKQPKIEWGNSAASIDPDELARIEQLFPQDNSSRNSSRKSTPTHTNSLSISASIANKTSQEQVVNNDDDDWSDFVSVPVPTPNRTFSHSPQKSKLETNNDEWSDFVSSVPNTQATVANLRITPAANSYGMPQFNSASWQNANFYNNPLSVYHRNQVNAVPNMTSTKFQNNNCSSYNNNNNTNNHHNNYSKSNNNLTQYLPNFQTTQQKLPQQQQKIQVMQDFSTSSSDFNLYRPNIPQSNYTGPTNSHFQVGSAKVAPTVSLIPDLGFVAPAMPVHTAIINALPKPNTHSKK